MAAFTYQHPPFHLDPLFLPNTPFYMSELLDEEGDTNNPTCFPYSSSSSSCVHHPLDQQQTEEKITNYTDSSSTIVDNFEEGGSDQIIIQEETPMEKKRKNIRDGSCFSSAQSKDANKRAKSKKQKKGSVGSIQVTEQVNKCRIDYKKQNQKKGLQVEDNPPPAGYVHVRARRGEATDSHSLAERVRRTKISERLKLLQSLVPGCDKVTSKALMLDEIINYVQSLQLQVEVLSTKLASMNPIFYEFGVDLDAAFMVKSEKPSNLASPLLPCLLQQSIPNTPTDLVDMTSTSSTANNFISSVPFSSLQQQPNDLFSAQENGDYHQLWHVGNQRQMFINQLGATNLFSFP